MFRDPVLEAFDHIEAWFPLGIWAVLDSDGNSLNNVSTSFTTRSKAAGY
jgi:hypothetical protein